MGNDKSIAPVHNKGGSLVFNQAVPDTDTAVLKDLSLLSQNTCDMYAANGEIKEDENNYGFVKLREIIQELKGIRYFDLRHGNI